MNNEDFIRNLAQSLIERAADLGMNVTITRAPNYPLAMGNVRDVIDVWPLRQLAEPIRRAKPDAGLIEAAPDLLAALDAMVNMIDYAVAAKMNGSISNCCPTTDKARAAIAKAQTRFSAPTVDAQKGCVEKDVAPPPNACSTEVLQEMLLSHLNKVDLVYVGNFPMMLFNREERTSEAKPLQRLSDQGIRAIAHGLKKNQVAYYDNALARAVIAEFCRINGIKDQS